MAKKIKKNKITSAQQFAMLKAKWGGDGNLRHHGFVWSKEFTPTALSDTYRLKIDYQEGYYPKSFIVFPKPLPLAAGTKRLPHTYDTIKQRLCLFKPDLYEWTSSMFIANTIIHWAIQWMFYYESWLFTGRWLGGGHGNWDAVPELREEELEEK